MMNCILACAYVPSFSFLSFGREKKGSGCVGSRKLGDMERTLSVLAAALLTRCDAVIQPQSLTRRLPGHSHHSCHREQRLLIKSK